MIEKIVADTHGLIEELNKGYDRFMRGERPTRDHALFKTVKKAVDPVLDIVDAWEAEAFQLIKMKKLTLLPRQISATKENMQAFMMHSFYKDTRKRQFVEIHKSCYYIFSQILKELSNE